MANTEYSREVQLLAAHQLAHKGTDEETAAEFHDAHPRLGGWHAAAMYLHRVSLERWQAEHPDDVMGMLTEQYEDLAAKVLMQAYWRAVASIIGWSDTDRLPEGRELWAIIRRLEQGEG